MFIGALSLEMAEAVKDVHKETMRDRIEADLRRMRAKSRKRFSTWNYQASEQKIEEPEVNETITQINQRNLVSAMLMVSRHFASKMQNRKASAVKH